jgi:hypothetical protein
MRKVTLFRGCLIESLFLCRGRGGGAVDAVKDDLFNV